MPDEKPSAAPVVVAVVLVHLFALAIAFGLIYLLPDDDAPTYGCEFCMSSREGAGILLFLAASVPVPVNVVLASVLGGLVGRTLRTPRYGAGTAGALGLLSSLLTAPVTAGLVAAGIWWFANR